MTQQLSFEVTSAELKRTTKKFGKMDVYALVHIGLKTFETKVHRGGDQNPVWKQKFEHTISKETFIGVELWENDGGKHVLLAEGKQDLADISRTGNRSLWINIFFQKKISGKVLFKLNWKDTPPGDGDKKVKKDAKEAQEQAVAPVEKPTTVHKELQEIGIQVSIIDLAMVKRVQDEERRRGEHGTMDKAVQANFWEVWEAENQYIKDHEKLSKERCCSRCGSLPRIKPRTKRNFSEDKSYLETQARKSPPVPKLDYQKKKETLYNVSPFVREEAEVLTYRIPLRTKRYEDLRTSRDRDKLSRVGNFILRNSFITYDVYQIR